jgi:hypothetical protein
MVADTQQRYCGVLCLHCRQPIPLSPRVMRRVAELRGSEPNPLRELGSHAFTLRCRACEREGMYAEPDLIDCEGTPRPRNYRSRPGSHDRGVPAAYTRAAGN